MSGQRQTTTGGDAIWERTDNGLKISDPDNDDAWVEMTYKAGIAPEKRLYFLCTDCGFSAPQPTLPGRGLTCPDCHANFDCQ